MECLHVDMTSQIIVENSKYQAFIIEHFSSPVHGYKNVELKISDVKAWKYDKS